MDDATITDCARGLDGDLRTGELEPGFKLVTDNERGEGRRDEEPNVSFVGVAFVEVDSKDGDELDVVIERMISQAESSALRDDCSE